MNTCRGSVPNWLPIAVLLPLAAGCVTTQSGPAPTKVATLQALPQPEPGAATTPAVAANEVSCRIQMIDGKEVQSSDSLITGHHRVIVALGTGESQHLGDVDLLIPAAKNYRIKAERNAELFTITLIEADTGKVAAQSAAMVDQVMKFKVFVGQK
ncbi:MAG TPA: hypothetical protein VG734_08970 [Lacunisphaera sp.]|nr:hypothetical protein [Lacunisphaera sp.]